MSYTNEEYKLLLEQTNLNLTLENEYINNTTKIIVKDKLGIQYKVLPTEPLKGKHPTFKAALNKNSCFSLRASIIHNNRFLYDKVNYINNHVKVKITCLIHGDFEQTPACHLRGQGCPLCRAKKISNSKRMTLETFLRKANKIHKYKYIYNLKEFKDSYKKINIICPIHGKFTQRPHAHLSGRGCPTCCKENAWGFSRSQWVTFCNNKRDADPKIYIIRLFNNDENFIKIGITSNTIKYRLYTMTGLYSYEILKEIKGSADFVYDKENELHKKFKKFKYIPQKNFKGSGECFTLDILNHIN